MTHQNLRLGKCWKLFWATLNVNFREMRDGKNVHFTRKWTRLLFYATNRLKNADFSSKKGFTFNFRVMCDGKHVHFTRNQTRFSFHATNRGSNADFSSKKGLNANFGVMCDAENVHFTRKRTRFTFHAMNRLKKANFSWKKDEMLMSGKCVTARMSISLGNEQGFYFMQRIGSKMPISAQTKVYNVNFRVMRDGENLDFTRKRTRFLFHATNRLKNANFSSKK